jgi:hypothetical protein
MLPALVLPMLVTDAHSPIPVALAIAFVVGLYALVWGIAHLRAGRIASRRGFMLTRQGSPKLYWANVGAALAVGAILIVTSLAILLYRRLH